jgi:probable rRNA maturation factor
MAVIFRQPVAGTSERALAAFLARAQKSAGLRGEVNVLVTSDTELRRLNRTFRGQDRPTDVLSFPSIMEGQAGDIAISAQTAARAARGLGHSVAEEVKVLLLHGVLHLAGYDHESDAGEMARKEEQLRRRLGLPVALTARAATL